MSFLEKLGLGPKKHTSAPVIGEKKKKQEGGEEDKGDKEEGKTEKGDEEEW